MSRNVQRKKWMYEIVLTNDRFMSSDGTPTMTMTARAPPRHSETAVAVAAVAVCSAWDLLYSLSGFMVGLGYRGCCYGGSDESAETQKRAS